MIDFRKDNDLIDYDVAHEFMKERVSDIISGTKSELLWFLQHSEIYTAGTSAKEADLVSPDRFPVYNTGRGGEYTYHGPGQRIAYVMLNLNRLHNKKPDLRKYVSTLEEWIINSIHHFGVTGETRSNRVGIWVKDKYGSEDKVAAIGIRVKKWITFHGISLNINPNLDNFSGIVPCGISDYGITSLEKLGVKANIEEIDEVLKKEFYKLFK